MLQNFTIFFLLRDAPQKRENVGIFPKSGKFIVGDSCSKGSKQKMRQLGVKMTMILFNTDRNNDHGEADDDELSPQSAI